MIYINDGENGGFVVTDPYFLSEEAKEKIRQQARVDTQAFAEAAKQCSEPKHNYDLWLRNRNNGLSDYHILTKVPMDDIVEYLKQLPFVAVELETGTRLEITDADNKNIDWT